MPRHLDRKHVQLTLQACPDPTVVGVVLAQLRYPARAWEVMAEADNFGVTTDLRIALSRLPAQTYADLPEVLSALAKAAQVLTNQDGGATRRSNRVH